MGPLPTIRFKSKDSIYVSVANYRPLQNYGTMSSSDIAKIVARCFNQYEGNRYGYSRSLNWTITEIKASLNPPEQQIHELRINIHNALKSCCKDPHGIMNLTPLTEELLPECSIC